MTSRPAFLRHVIGTALATALPSSTTRRLRLLARRKFTLQPQFPETPIWPTFDQCKILDDATLLLSAYSTSQILRVRGTTALEHLLFPRHGSADAIAYGKDQIYAVFAADMGLPGTSAAASTVRVDLGTRKYDTLSFSNSQLPGYLLPVGKTLYATNGQQIYVVDDSSVRARLVDTIEGADKTIVASMKSFWIFGHHDVQCYDPITRRSLRSSLAVPFNEKSTRLRGARAGCYTITAHDTEIVVQRFAVTNGAITQSAQNIIANATISGEPSVDIHDAIWFGEAGKIYCVALDGNVKTFAYQVVDTKSSEDIQAVLSDGRSNVWVVGQQQSLAMYSLY